MALWNSIMSMPLGQTGYGVKAADDTKFTLERVDPRILMMGSAGGMSSGARASSSRKDSEDELKPFKSTAKAEWDILQIENSIKMEEKALEQEYIDKMNTLDLKDPDRITFEREFAERMNGISQKKLNAMMLRNQAGYEREKVDQFKTEIKNNSNDLAFLVDMGSITHEGDLTRLLFQDGGVGEIVHTTRLGRPETLQEYVDGYNTTWSGLTNRGLLNEFKRPYAEIDTDVQYNKHISDIVKSRASNLRQTFQPLIDIGDQNILDAIISSSIHGVDFPYLELDSNIEPLKEIINDIWAAVPESSRARIMSDVLKMGVAVPQIDPKDGKEKLMYMSGSQFLDEVHKAAFTMSAPLPDGIAPDSDEGIKLLRAKEKAEKHLEKLDKALLSTAKDKMIRDAYGTSIGLDKIEYKINEFSTRQEKSLDGGTPTYFDILNQRIAESSSETIVSMRFVDGEHQMTHSAGKQTMMDRATIGQLENELGLKSEDKGKITLDSWLGKGLAIANQIPINSGMIKTDKGKFPKIVGIGAVAQHLPMYAKHTADEKAIGVYDKVIGGSYETYVELILEADSESEFNQLKVPVPVIKDGVNTIEFITTNDARIKDPNFGNAYKSMNMDRNEKQLSIFIPVGEFIKTTTSQNILQKVFMLEQAAFEDSKKTLDAEAISEQKKYTDTQKGYVNWDIKDKLKGIDQAKFDKMAPEAVKYMNKTQDESGSYLEYHGSFHEELLAAKEKETGNKTWTLQDSTIALYLDLVDSGVFESLLKYREKSLSTAYSNQNFALNTLLKYWSMSPSAERSLREYMEYQYDRRSAAIMNAQFGAPMDKRESYADNLIMKVFKQK